MRYCAIGGSLHGALRTTRIARIMKKFCTRSERIIQSISDISRDYRGQSHFYAWNLKTIILEKIKKKFFIIYFHVC